MYEDVRNTLKELEWRAKSTLQAHVEGWRHTSDGRHQYLCWSKPVAPSAMLANAVKAMKAGKLPSVRHRVCRLRSRH